MNYKIAITGEFRRGKDTLANLIETHLEGEATRLAFADALKRELAEMVYGYTCADLNEAMGDDVDLWEQLMRKDRHINGVGWQWWGEYRRQKFGQNYWINHHGFLGRYARASDHEHHIIVTDMRHHNEAQWCREHGFYLIRIEGPCHTVGELRDARHPSEIHVPDLPVHLVVHNIGGLDALRDKVADRLMPKLRSFFDAVLPG